MPTLPAFEIRIFSAKVPAFVVLNLKYALLASTSNEASNLATSVVPDMNVIHPGPLPLSTGAGFRNSITEELSPLADISRKRCELPKAPTFAVVVPIPTFPFEAIVNMGLLSLLKILSRSVPLPNPIEKLGVVTAPEPIPLKNMEALAVLLAMNI
jgi:hypothetical protein